MEITNTENAGNIHSGEEVLGKGIQKRAARLQGSGEGNFLGCFIKLQGIPQIPNYVIPEKI